MNERIKELAERATTYIEPTANSGEGWIFDKEKFAELIVRECLTLVEPGLDSGDEWCVTLKETAQMIKEHFGVEE